MTKVALMKLPVVLILSLSLHANIASAAGKDQVVAPDASNEQQQALVERYENMNENYEPRTEHFLEDGTPKYLNRLITENSPYLLQHAHNPVNWFPWGEEAFARAVAEDKPIFLSIGYATCHWCHVMERESFENEDIAQQLNEKFVAIKVDREQLPDVDALYMTAVQMIAGNGGWPMSSFLDTEGRPYFGGTYFPPAQFSDLLDRVAFLWGNQRDELLTQAGNVQRALSNAHQLGQTAKEVGAKEIDQATENAIFSFDSDNGGFSHAPKFPQESTLLFLLEQARITNSPQALKAADYTLRKMAAGGIHDQIGGGFHRYSVDHEWLVPHFEKMLYNQANLARAYVLGWQLSGHQDHAATARGILDYVLREMTTDTGVFYSATDADSEGREGAFFVWTPETLSEVLSEDDAKLASEIWGIDEVGNFEGETILNRPTPLVAIAKSFDMSVDEVIEKRAQLAEQLRIARESREHPLLDDKILTGWNGLMIIAFAEAGMAFDDKRYLEAAIQAATQLLDNVLDSSGRLKRSQFNGVVSIDAKQVDFAWLAEGLIALYDATGDKLWLNKAQELTDTMIAEFHDVKGGGFFMGSATVSGTSLVTRPKDLYDASTPSGNAAALRVLSRLVARTGKFSYARIADELIAAYSDALTRHSNGFYYLLTALSEYTKGESGLPRYAGKGVARVDVRRQGSRLELQIDLDEGWHINSNEPLQDYLIGTELKGVTNKLSNVQYPAPHTRKLGFQSEELSLYEGRVLIEAELPAAAATDNTNTNSNDSATLELVLQACNDEICLAPETLAIALPRAN